MNITFPLKTVSFILTGIISLSFPFQLRSAEIPNLTTAATTSMMSKKEFFPTEFIDLSRFNTMKTTEYEKTYIDNSIDEDSYYIGMGDVFTISIIEMPSITYTAKINQNGDVHFNDFGILKLGKVTLREAKEAIAEFVQKRLSRKNSVYVTLSEGKMATVSVNGNITLPGTMIIEGIFRIWDCLLKANNGIIPTIADIDLRNVAVQNKDTTKYYDLLRYYTKNDLSQNPYVYPGDNIFISPATQRVFVQGLVKNPPPGFIPIKNNETLGDFLEILALDNSTDSGLIIIQKGATSANRYDTTISFEQADGIILENNDVISIPVKADYPKVQTVSVTGAVQRPGMYTCIEKRTRVEEIMKKCGGYLDDANPQRAYIIRNAKKLIEPNGETKTSLPMENIQPLTLGSARPEMNLAFSRTNTFKDYSVIALDPNDLSIRVELGDQIVVPYKETVVYVSGSVKNPGGYPYIEGKSYKYYVKCAGGFSNKSDRSSTYVLAKYHTSLKVKNRDNIEQGDIIVVPDAPQNKYWTTVIAPILQVLGTATAVIATIVSLNATLKN